MKKYLFIAACSLALAGCQKAGTGGYGESDTGADTSLEPRSSVPASSEPSLTTTNTNQSSINVDINASGAPAASVSASATSSSQSDDAMSQRIRMALTTRSAAEADPDAAGMISTETLNNVHITAANGTVTISGNVASEAEKQALQMKIQKIEGVTRVENQLTVSQPQGQTRDAGSPGSAGQEQRSSSSPEQVLNRQNDPLNQDRSQPDKRN